MNRVQTTSLLLFTFFASVACSEDSGEEPTEVRASVSDEISTVVFVRWKTESESVGYVEYGLTQGRSWRTPLEPTPTREHERALLGLAPDTEYTFRVVSDDEMLVSPESTVRTGFLPTGMPSVSVEGRGHDGYTIVPVLGTTTAITIIDGDGEIVWYHTDDRELDFYRARLSNDGKSVIYNAASISGDPADDSEIVRVALDGSESSAIPIPLLAHDFVEHPDGTLAAIVVEQRDPDDRRLWGNQIVEVDASGAVTPVWSTWDCFDPVEDPGDDPNGWTFANALDFDPIEDVYYVGMRNLSSIAKVNRQTGECEWVLGLHGSTFDFDTEAEIFLHQHQFQVHGNRVVVFDNDGSLENESRVLEYELDLDTNVATQVWSYSSEPKVSSFVLGEPTRLENGDTFVNWGAAGQLERVSPDGESVWKLNTDLGHVLGFHTLAPSLYPVSP